MKPVVLITGAAGGIGAAAAELFAHCGWAVAGLDLDPEGVPGEVALFIRGDLGDPAVPPRAIASVEQTFGRLDCLVNNAAVQLAAPMSEINVAQWDRVMAVNARAPFLLCREAVALLAARRGSVVNVSSVHAVATSRHLSAYASSKGALVALTRSLAVELAPRGVRVNAVLPGAIDTPMLRQGLHRGHLDGGSEEELLDALACRTVCGRLGRPADVARAIHFLADRESSDFITGQTLIVDGGATACLSTEAS